MSVFEIVGDDVTISRYDADGRHGIKPYAGNWTTTDANESTYGHQLNMAVFEDSVSIPGNDFAVSIPDAVVSGGLRAGFSVTAAAGGSCVWSSDNTDVATVTGGSDGSAVIHAKTPGVAKITATASDASSSFYLTVTENNVEVQDGIYYKLVTQLTEGKSYMLVSAKSESAAYALKAAGSGTAMEAPTTVGVDVNVYNSGVPFVLWTSTEPAYHLRWQYIEVDYGRGYGVLKDVDRSSRLAIGDIGSGDHTALQIQPYGTADMSFGWAYSYDEGLYSEATVGSQKIYASRFYDSRNADAVVDEWGAVLGGRYDPNFYSKLYAYEETPLTYTLSLSDMRGEVAVGGTDTGTKIVKTWCTGKVEYFDLTTEHLSVSSGKAGTYDPDEFSSSIPAPETFQWNIGDITERELVLSYYVYLEDSMGEDGGHTAGIYDTNQYAEIHYLNYQDEPRTQGTVSPDRYWESARVNYGFYLVNENGEIIQHDGSVTSFANKVVVGGLSKDQVINLNTSNKVTPQCITLADGTVIDATLAIPEGYELYVPDPSATIRTNSGNSTGGKWDVDASGTTYVDNGSTAVNSAGSTKTGEYDDTTVWFAVVYTGTGAPVTNKTVEATNDPNEFVLTLEAFAQGKNRSLTKPADIVLVLDHSGSMRTPVGASSILHSGTRYTGDGAIARSQISTEKGAHTGYYVCQSTSSNSWFVMRFDKAENKWYGYSIPSTESIVDIRYQNADDAKAKGGYTEHTMTQSWAAGNVPNQLVFYKSQYAALYDTLLEFVDKLKNSGVAHNVSIIGFAGSKTEGSRLYVGDNADEIKFYNTMYNKSTEARRTELYRKAPKNVQDPVEYAELLQVIESIETNHSFTCPSAGLHMASDLFRANEVDLSQRNRVMILFTDGIPNKRIGGDETTGETQSQIFNEIVSKAYDAKQQGAQIYAISTTTLSEGEDRTFLSRASSDYPDAVSYDQPGSPIATPHFTKRAEDIDDFRISFDSITESVTSVVLTETAVLREVLTDYFVLNPDGQVDVQVYTAAYNGNGTYGALVPAEGCTYALSSSEGEGGRLDTIEVTGFDYANEYISSIPRTVNGKNYYGSKLIVKVRIKTRDGFWGGNNVPTNEPTTGIYDKNRVLAVDFPEPQVNVPINVEVTAKDKTIYYGDTIDANQDGWKGDELLQQITVGTQTGANGQIVNGSTVTVSTKTNGDGTTTTTFVPEQSWMDDFATMDWADGSTGIESDLSNTQPKDYTYGVDVKPNSDGSQNNGVKPGTTENIAGTPTNGDSASDTGHIFVKVPQVTFKDSVTDFGSPTAGYDYTGKDLVKTEWVFMPDNKNTDNAPAPTTEAPELVLTYTPEEGVTQFVGDTKVEVAVSRKDQPKLDIQSVTGFHWEDCDHTEHGSCGKINTHKGDDRVHEFWVHTDIEIVPDTVVIDFGLPVDIDPLTNDLDGVANVTKKLVGIGSDFQRSKDFTFGAAEILTGDQLVRYTLHTSNGMTMYREETFKYQGTYTIKGRDYIKDSTITVIPATIIYYEDSFVNFSSWTKDESESWVKDQASAWETYAGHTEVQGTDRPGAGQIGRDMNNLYGYDGAYTDESLWSMGSYHKFTADATHSGEASFTFKGKAFDIIALSSGTTGTILVNVYKKSASGELVKSVMVDTYYGYQYTDIDGDGEKEWNPTDPSDPNALYQVPVMKVDMETYGTYHVVITVSYNKFFDHGQYNDGSEKYDFMLDAVRIYDQANDGKSSQVIENAYVADGEGWPSYIELRNILIGANTFDSLGVDGDVAQGVVFIDGIPALNNENASGENGGIFTDPNAGKQAAIADYANFGPNNELYLAPGQGISFALNGQDGIANVENVHLALKSVGGTSQVVICGVKEDNTLDFVAGSLSSYMEVKTATDLYYDISKLKECKAIVIYNPNNPANGAPHSILSITNLKLTHAANPANKGTVQPTVSRAVAKLALNALKPVVVNPFADVREESYYYNSILWAAAKGITCGTDATHFSPDETCSRGQVVTFLWRSAGCPEPEKGTHPFVDVPSDSYYYKAVLWAVENGITAGVDERHFGPNEVCSRGQVVTFLWRAGGFQEPGVTEQPFTDVVSGSYYHKAVLWAVENGITSGVSANSFAPNLTCTRGQVVTFLYRAYHK